MTRAPPIHFQIYRRCGLTSPASVPEARYATIVYFSELSPIYGIIKECRWNLRSGENIGRGVRLNNRGSTDNRTGHNGMYVNVVETFRTKIHIVRVNNVVRIKGL